MRHWGIIIALAVLCGSGAYAKDTKIDHQSFEKEGFSDVSEVLKKMTPEQIEAVKKQAEAMMPELQNMSQEEIDQLTQQMRDMQSSIDFQAVDVQGLDPSKSKGLKGIQQDVKQFKKMEKKEIPKKVKEVRH